MNFTSQICTTREQSERLLALGLKKETADCCLVDDTMGGYDFQPYCVARMKHILHNMKLCRNVLPAWSLDRLIDMLEDYKIDLYTGLNRYDEAIALIQSLIHIGGFNKEYLTQ